MLEGRLIRDATGTFVPVLLLSLQFGLLGVYLPLYGRALGASGFEVGALFSAFSIVGVLGRPLVGRGVDWIGARPFVLAGAGLYLLASLLYATSLSLVVLYAARLVQGAASSLFWVAMYAALADFGAASGRSGRLGRLAEAQSAGASLGTVAAYGAVVALGVVAGWRYLFVLFALTTLAALALFASRAPAVSTMRRDRTRDPVHLTRPFVVLLLVALLSSVAYSLFSPILLLYLKDRFAASDFWIGLAYAPSAVVAATMPGRLGSVADRWSRRGVMGGALVVSGAVSLLFPVAPTLLLMSAVWVLEALVWSAALPATDALVAELTGGDIRGTAYGVYAAVSGTGAVIGPLLGGWMYDSVGRASPFWASAVVLPLAGTLALALLPRAVTGSPHGSERPAAARA